MVHLIGLWTIMGSSQSELIVVDTFTSIFKILQSYNTRHHFTLIIVNAGTHYYIVGIEGDSPSINPLPIFF